MRAAIKRWWDGQEVPDDPHRAFVFLDLRDRHWTSRAAHWFADFVADNRAQLLLIVLGAIAAG